MDNDAFSGFDERRFMDSLDMMRGVPGCRFVSAPDVVGDAVMTLAQFYQWELIIRYHGFPVAFVAQDHIEHLPVPWSLIDALFVGGSTAWKLGPGAARMIAEARARDKWVHIGRVNSYQRIRYAGALGADSIDGTHFSIEPRKIREKLPAVAHRQLGLPGVYGSERISDLICDSEVSKAQA